MKSLNFSLQKIALVVFQILTQVTIHKYADLLSSDAFLKILVYIGKEAIFVCKREGYAL